MGHAGTVPHPAIVLISEHHADTLATQFARYEREYDVHSCRSAAEAHLCMLELREAGSQVALFVAESVLPDATVYEAVAGIFAAGDIRSGSMKRVASASGEGASVVSLVHTWLEPGR